MEMFFRNNSMRDSHVCAAAWEKNRNEVYLTISGYSFSPEEAENLANWILKTLPMKGYVITNVFKNIPSAVTFYNQIKETEIQVEEVWE